MDGLTYSVRDHQKIKRYTRRLTKNISGHRRLTPLEKKYKRPYRRSDEDK